MNKIKKKPDSKEGNETNGCSDYPDIIDGQLDIDLTEHAEQTRKSLYKDDNIDFNFSSSSNAEPSLVETQVLSINPTRSFSNQIDIEQKKLSDAGFIVPDKANSLLSKAFRQIKRPVMNIVRGKTASTIDNANIIMLTSSVANEGKTFCAINMAMSVAMEKDRRVLLIDADVNNPSHHEYFGVKMDYGLTDVLTGKVDDVSNVIYKTNLSQLSLMFAGSPTPHAPELFASRTMENFVDELSKRYEDRVIIFDSAPLLLLTEASVLASHMGQVILVIEAEKTTQEMVNRSLDLLSNKVILLLLNKARQNKDLGGYGYSRQYDD